MLEGGHLEISIDIGQSQLQTRLHWIDGNTQLGTLIRVGNVEQVPWNSGLLTGAESAVETKLVRESTRKRVHGAESQISLPL